MEYYSISSPGNSADFGDLTVSRTIAMNGSNGPGHGGLEDELPQRESVNYMPGSGRGFIGGGMDPGATNELQLIHIPTLGNAIDFGDLTTVCGAPAGVSNGVKGIFGGGYDGSDNSVNVIGNFSMANSGNAADFGDLTAIRMQLGGHSSNTRGMFFGGDGPSPGYAKSDVVDYITMASSGDASDFGNLSAARSSFSAAGSTTRGIACGGKEPTKVNTVDYFTIASTGNSTDFGNLTIAAQDRAAVSSATRIVSAGGKVPGASNVMDYGTIASAADFADFGDLTAARGTHGGMSNRIRGVFHAGHDGSDNTTTMDYITIASTGNAADFGDAVAGANFQGGTSDSHGGL